MKNLRIGVKLIVTFTIITIMLLTVTITSIFSLNAIGTQFDNFYKNGYEITNKSMDLRRTIQSVSKNVAYTIMSDNVSDMNNYIDMLNLDSAYIVEGIAFMEENFRGDPQLIADINDFLLKAVPIRNEIIKLTLANKNAEAATLFFESYEPILLTAQEKFIAINNEALKNAEEGYATANTTKTQTTVIIIALSIVALVFIIALAIYITHSLTKPIIEIEKVAKKMSEGDLNITIAYESRDELGSLANSMREMIIGLKGIIEDVSTQIGDISQGNFSTETEYPEIYIGNYEPLLISMRNINSTLSNTLYQITESSEQVAIGSSQVSSGSQALSQGATEQAAGIEELSATISDISAMITSNAESAQNAKGISQQALEDVNCGSDQMKSMIGAMEKISSTSNEIRKIIKNIEDIAFQTNILALNAAVEAARAGEAGKGFAVVAEEVRNLASKSAESAKTTADLIESSVVAVSSGTNIANETAKSLERIVTGTQKTTDLIENIASSSSKQSIAVEEVTISVDQISAVIQTNSATAEESAASSEELSAQADMLKTLVSQFKLKKNSDIQHSDYAEKTTNRNDMYDLVSSESGNY